VSCEDAAQTTPELHSLRLLQSGPTDSDELFVETKTGTVPVDWYGSYLNGASSAETFYTWASLWDEVDERRFGTK
jgi:hypothetical protein